MSNYEEGLFVNRTRIFGGLQKLLQPEVSHFGMVVEADEGMGKSWLAQKFYQFCQQPENQKPVAYVDFGLRRGQHNIQTPINLIQILAAQLQSPGSDDFPSLAQALDPTTRRLTPVTKKLHNNLRPADLKFLTGALGIRIEDIVGDGSDPFFLQVQKVVDFFDRLGKLAALIDTIPTLPTMEGANVNWWAGLEFLREDSPQPPTLQADDRFVTDLGSELRFADERNRNRAQREISAAFFQDLEALAQRADAVVLLLDSFQDAPQEVGDWVLAELLGHLRAMQTKVIVLISGRPKLPELTISDRQRIVAAMLDPLEAKDVQEYLFDIRGFSPATLIPRLKTLIPPTVLESLENKFGIPFDANGGETPGPDGAANALDELIVAILQLAIQGNPGTMASIAGNLTVDQPKHDPFFDDVPA